MLQKDYYGGEGSGEERFYECIECDEAIVNPICPNCLTTELEAWLTNYSNLRQKLLPILKKYIKRLIMADRHSIRCVHCNHARASLCPYCFSKFVFEELNRLKVNKQVIREFIQFFNLDFNKPTPYFAEDFVNKDNKGY